MKRTYNLLVIITLMLIGGLVGIASVNAEDYNLWVNMFLKGGKLAVMGGKPVTYYNRSKHPKEWWKISDMSATQTRIIALSSIIPDFNISMLKMHLCELTPIIIKGNKKTKILNNRELKKFKKNHCLFYDIINGK